MLRMKREKVWIRQSWNFRRGRERRSRRRRKFKSQRRREDWLTR